MIYVPIYEEEKLVFHLTYEWPIYNRGRTFAKIGATLLTNAIIYAVPTINLMRRHEQRPSRGDAIKLLGCLGRSIVESRRIRQLYYPSYLLEENSISINRVESIIRQLGGIMSLPGTHYSAVTNEISFYIMHMNLMFATTISRRELPLTPNSIANFEAQLNSAKMKTEYVEIWSKQNRVLSLYDDGLYYLLYMDDRLLMIIAST